MKRIFLILLLFSTAVFGESTFKIISLKHRFANDLITILRPLVGEFGTVTGTDNHLLIRANPQQMQDIEAIILQMDIARTNRKISVRSTSQLQNQRDNAQITGDVKKGQIIVNDASNNDENNDRNNDRNNGSKEPNTARVGITRNNTNSQCNSQQFINVLEGERAFIKVGQLIPYSKEWINITKQYVQISRTTQWRDISTGFAVWPRTINNMITLEITPSIMSNNNQGYVDFKELTTVINVKIGEWVDIAQTMQSKDAVSRKILGLQSTIETNNTNISIKVD